MKWRGSIISSDAKYSIADSKPPPRAQTSRVIVGAEKCAPLFANAKASDKCGVFVPRASMDTEKPPGDMHVPPTPIMPAKEVASKSTCPFFVKVPSYCKGANGGG